MSVNRSGSFLKLKNIDREKVRAMKTASMYFYGIESILDPNVFLAQQYSSFFILKKKIDQF